MENPAHAHSSNPTLDDVAHAVSDALEDVLGRRGIDRYKVKEAVSDLLPRLGVCVFDQENNDDRDLFSGGSVHRTSPARR